MTTDARQGQADPPPAAAPLGAPSAPAPPAPEGEVPTHEPIDPRRVPALDTSLAPQAVLQRLAALSKRGKLAGFRDLSAPGTHRFVAQVFGNPYDRWLHAAVQPHAGGSRLLLRCTLGRKFPAIVIGLLVFSIWPGVWLTDSMLSTYWAWYGTHIETWWWYLPLMVLSLPPMWKQFRKSEAGAPDETGRVVHAIREALGARDAGNEKESRTE